MAINYDNIKAEINRDSNLPLSIKKTLKDAFLYVSDAVEDLEDDVAAITPLTGTITKTLGSSGADFSTITALQAYINANKFFNATLSIEVAEETLSFADQTLYWTLPKSQATLWITGIGATPSILQFTGTSGGFSCVNPEQNVDFENINIESTTSAGTPVTAAGGTFSYTTGAIEANGIAFELDDGVFAELADLTIDANVGQTGNIVHIAIDAFVTMDGVAITGPAGFTNTTGIKIERNCHLEFGTGACTIDDCTTGILASTGSRVFISTYLTPTGNDTDYNPAINKVGYDGSFISNGTAALSFLA